MQLQHELTLKRLEMEQKYGREHVEITLKKLELAQKKGLEHLSVSRDTANLLTVSGACLVVVSSGAWLVSHLLTDTRVSLVSLEREMFNHGDNFRSLICGGRYPEKSIREEHQEMILNKKW